MKLIKIVGHMLLALALNPALSFAMGIKKPTNTTPGFGGPMWLAPNVKTPDFINLFTQPELWPQARSRTSAIQFYAQMFFDPGGCPSCGPNTYENFVAHGVFDRMNEWNIEVALEVGSVKPGDCAAELNTNFAKQILGKIRNAGSRLKYISIDEPFVAGTTMCNGLSPEQIADSTASFIQRTLENARQLDQDGLSIGLIESYPTFSADKIAWFLQLLHERGATPSHLNLDFDLWAVRGKGISQSEMTADLRKIQTKCRELGIPFGLIYWGHDGDSPSIFSKDVLDLVTVINRVFGSPDRVVVQSWAQTKGGENLNPPNLSESTSNTLTGILLKVINGY